MKNFNNNNLVISPAKKNDIVKILDLEKKSFDDPWDLDLFESAFSYCNISIAKNNDNIVAYLVSKIVLDELQIDNLAVDINFRRNNIATLLINYIVINSPSISKIYLEVSVKNTAAINLYKKLGFTNAYLRKKYYLNGDDANIMLCNLKNYKGIIND